MKVLRPAGSYRELLLDPLGRYAFEDRFGAWALHRELIGFAVWGRPGPSDVEALFTALDGPHPASLALPCDVLFDARGLEGADPGSFNHLLGVTKARIDRIAARVRREVIVRPSGLVGAVVEGFSALIGPRYGWQVFDSLPEALTALGVDDPQAQAQHLDELIAVASAGSPVVARLRSWLAADLGRKSIEQAARALNRAVRTLQRELREAGTSFRKESDAVLLSQAKQLLADPDSKLEAIAVKLGCASLASFDAFFHRTAGQSPSEYRTRQPRTGRRDS